MIWPCWICRSDQPDCGHREAEIAKLAERAEDLRRQLRKTQEDRSLLERRLARAARKKAGA